MDGDVIKCEWLLVVRVSVLAGCACGRSGRRLGCNEAIIVRAWGGGGGGRPWRDLRSPLAVGRGVLARCPRSRGEMLADDRAPVAMCGICSSFLFFFSCRRDSEAAGHVDHAAGHVAAVRPRQEAERAPTLPRASRSGGSDAGSCSASGDTLAQHFGRHVGRHDAGLDDIDGDVASAEIARDALRVADDGRLRPGIVGNAGEAERECRGASR